MLKKQLEDDLKTALKAGDKTRVSTLRMVIAAVINKEIERQKKDIGLSDEEIVEVLASEIRRRKDAISDFEKGGRNDLAEKEKKEVLVIKKYLPEEISDDELLRIVREGIREAGAREARDFGKVMKVIMPVLKGKASGDRVSAVLKNELEGR